MRDGYSSSPKRSIFDRGCARRNRIDALLEAFNLACPRPLSHGTEFSNFFPCDVHALIYMRYLFLTMKSLVQASLPTDLLTYSNV